MKEILEKCCGIDVHKKTFTACIIIGTDKNIKKEIKTYSTMTQDIKDFAKWLKKNKIIHVAMESTGVYWKPIFNILEKDFEVILVNSRHVKNVPGRKTDVKDSEWLCKLLKSGLLENSFIPPKDFRNLRSLLRYRKKCTEVITAEKNRILKIFEISNIKISSVISNVFGVSGWEIINAIISGEKDPEKLSDLIFSKVRASKKELKRALDGFVDDKQVFLLKKIVSHIRYLKKTILSIETKVSEISKKYKKEIELMKTVPGVQELSAVSILAEIGNDMSKFPSEQHLSSWAGVSPGSYESAGKKKVQEYCRGEGF